MTHWRRNIGLGVGAALVAGLLGAAAPVPSPLIAGAGLATCDEWVDQMGSPEHALMEQWLFGSLSRGNYDHDRDILEGRDAAALRAWVDSFCKAHPKATLQATSLELEHDLYRGTAKRRKGAR